MSEQTAQPPTAANPNDDLHLMSVTQLQSELTRLDNLPEPPTKAEQARRQIAGRLCVEKQQGPCAPVLGGGDFVLPRAQRHDLAQVSRNERAAKLRAFVQQPPVDLPRREVPLDVHAELLKLTPKSGLLLEGDILTALDAAKRAVCGYEIWCLATAEQRNPEQAVRELQEQLGSVTDQAQAEAIADRISALTGWGSEALAANLTAQAHSKFEPAKAALLKVLALARDRLAQYEAFAIAEEGVFFESFGLPREVTSVSRRCAAARQEAQAEIDALNAPMPVGPIPSIMPRALRWLGVKEAAE